MAKKAEIKVNMAAFEKAFKGVAIDVKAKAANGMAKAIIREMLDLISKGVSPIHGHGRFPPYKSQINEQEAKREAEKGFGTKKQQAKAFRAMKKNLAPKYPDSVKEQYPRKKRRPVNLYLSGDFLSNLTHIPIIGERPGAEIGFFDTKSQKKEQGHREMANGQGFRPIIPMVRKGEQFSKAVLMEAANFLKQVVRDYYKKAFK
jgi:hypothetical protein